MKETITDYYRNITQVVEQKIMSEDDTYIMQVDNAELIEYYYKEYCFEPIEFDSSQEESMNHVKEIRIIPAHQRDSFYQNQGDLKFEYEMIIVNIPIKRNNSIRQILNLKSSQYIVSGDPRVTLTGDNLQFSIDIKGYRLNLTNDEVIASVKSEKDKIIKWINLKNANIESENELFLKEMVLFLHMRKDKLAKDVERLKTLTKSINIPLHKKDNVAATRIKLDTKLLIQRIKPSVSAKEEYVLDRAKVLDIIEIIDNQGRQFEKTPNSYKNSQEEDLRNILLVSLNSIFEGKATGETFSKKGKTDIYLNIDKGQILICECKIWGGGKLYMETIDQLIGYLTWRNNYGIIITFVRQMNFTRILDEINSIVTKHSTYLNGINKISQTHFMSNHKIPQDADKSVELHHLFYNLYI